MKKILRTLLLIIILLPLEINASTLDLKLTCPQTAYPNDIIECSLSYTNDLSLNALITKYNLPDIIEYNDLILKDNWIKYYNNETGFVIGSEITPNNDIATIKLKISNNVKEYKEYTIELINIDASDKNFNSLTQDNITSTIKIIKKEEPKPTPEPEKPNDTTNETPKDDNQNNNLITNQPTQNNPIEKEEPILNNDSKLKSIKLSYGEIKFDPNIFEYKITVPNEITTMTIEAIPNNEKAKVTIEKPQELNTGDNKITITVEAEDKTTSKYIITITREEKIEDIIPSKDEGNSESPNIRNITYLIILITVILISISFKKILNRKNKNN